MIPIMEHMKLSREERRVHLRLDLPCVDRLEDKRQDRKDLNHSQAYRGILAFTRDTTLPAGRKVHACHACHNPRCSNPLHLYWGTPRDNYLDEVEAGKYIPIKERVINKLGKAGWAKAISAAGKKGGEAGRGKKKSYVPVTAFKKGVKRPRHKYWSTGSRKGTKMPRTWARRGPTANKRK